MDSILDTAPCGFLSLGDDGTIRELNTTLASMLGFRSIELAGWHLEKILGPGSRIFYQTHVFPLLKLHNLVEEIYLPLRSKDGVDVPMLLNAVRRERDGAPVNDCIFVRMIQRHEFEGQLVQARRLAEEANASKAKFLSMMSHDLRTPLTTISGYTSLMASENLGPLSKEQRDALSRISDAGGELLRMINDILSFAQIDSGRVTMRTSVVTVRHALDRAEQLLRLRAETAGLTLSIETSDDAATVHADPDRLQQVLLNLITNAIKFTPAGGSVAVTCTSRPECVQIHVRDSGTGIPPDQLERIFDPFVQLDHQPEDASQRGVGLGLAISREFSRAMGGDLLVESRPGKGSRFTIELPAALEAADRAGAS